MQFSYSLTREEFAAANAKYLKKTTLMSLIIGIILVCFSVIMLVVAFIPQFNFNKAQKDTVVQSAFLVIFIALIFFTLFFGIRRSSKTANAEFFNWYNVDGVLTYNVELTEKELVIKLQQNVSHLPLNGIRSVVAADGFMFAIFKTNTILIVKNTEDTAQLIQSLKSVASVQK